MKKKLISILIIIVIIVLGMENVYAAELDETVQIMQVTSTSKTGNTTSGGSTSTNGKPGNTTGGSTTVKGPTTTHTLDEIVKEGQDFISAGEQSGEKISQEDLQKLSNTIYNILLVLGIVIAVILGGILGIKFITEGVEGQADVKKALIPYILGCVIIFGAFAIWKIVVNILQSM